MSQYTVIGFYESTGQTFVHHTVADNAFEAMSYIATGADEPEDMQIVVCLPGFLDDANEDIHFPGEGLVSAATILEQPEVFQ